MKVRKEIVVSLVCVLVQLFGGLAAAQALVLCIGSNGHRAFEAEHGGIGCPVVAAPDTPLAGRSSWHASGIGCDDLPVFGPSAELPPMQRQARVRGHLTGFFTILAPLQYLLSGLPVRSGTDVQAGADGRPLADLKTVVLLT